MLGTAARQRAILAALALLMPSVEAFGHVPAGFSPKLHFAHARDTTACRSRTAGVVQLSARFMRDGARPSLERKDALWLLAAGSAALLAPEHAAAQDDAAPCTCGKDDTACSCNAAAPVVVIGAAGGTGGEVVRSLLRSQVPVVASTRRPVAIAARDVLAAEGKDQKPLSVDTLLLDKQTDETKLRRVIADAVKPDTLRAALKGARAVIFCAGTRPKVEATATPGTNPGGGGLGNNDLQQGAAAYYQRTAAGPEESAEDVGLVNVAAECVRQRIPRLVIVSSICAKCQRGRVSSLDGEQIDRGAASCDSCYRKQDGEQAVRNLYASAPAGLGYTVVRPGLLSRGPARGPSAVEFNQGTSKSGIISRADLADVLVAASTDVGAAGKSFEVYYSDTAQPVDMYASLQNCKSQGKSVKQCFFGEGFDDSKTINLEDVLSRPLQGSLFSSGTEVQGARYGDMFARLNADAAEPFDVNSLASPSIL